MELELEMCDENEVLPHSGSKRRPPPRTLSAVWQFFERGEKDQFNRYSARCKVPGCTYVVKQGKVRVLERHVLGGCKMMTAEDRQEATELLEQEAMMKVHKTSEASGSKDSDANGGGGAGTEDHDHASGKLSAGLQQTFDQHLLRLIACSGLPVHVFDNEQWKIFVHDLRPNYTPASESAVRRQTWLPCVLTDKYELYVSVIHVCLHARGYYTFCVCSIHFLFIYLELGLGLWYVPYGILVDTRRCYTIRSLLAVVSLH
jgi:hypothetical protein